MTEINKSAITGSMLQRLNAVSPVNAINELLLQPNKSMNLSIGTILSGIVLSQDSSNNLLVNTQKGNLLVNMATPAKVDNEISFRITATNPMIIAELVDDEGKKIEREVRKNNNIINKDKVEVLLSKVTDKTELSTQKSLQGNLSVTNKSGLYSFTPILDQEIVDNIKSIKELKVYFKLGEMTNIETKPLLIANEDGDYVPLKAVVISQQSSQNTVFNTALGTIELNEKVKIPPESEIILHILGFKMPQVSIEDQIEDFHERPTGSTWKALDQIINIATKNNIPIQKDALPTTNREFIIKLLFYMVALKSNDAEEWLGSEVVNLLKKTGETTILSQFVNEFNEAKLLFNKQTNSEWISLIFPLFEGSHVRQEEIKIKKHEINNEGKTERDTRFVVDYNSKILGSMQLDGLIKEFISPNSPSRMQLVIRSEKEFPEIFANEIRSILSNLAQVSKMSVNVSFATTNDFVHVLNESIGLSRIYL